MPQHGPKMLQQLLEYGVSASRVFKCAELANSGDRASGGGATGAANASAYRGTTLLAIAAAKGNLEALRVLLDAGAPIDQRCEEGSVYAGMTALEMSRAHQQCDAEMLLLTAGASA